MSSVERSPIRQIEGRTLEAEERFCLSPRQIQILEKAALGLSNREISEELEGLSERTVKNHFYDKDGIFVHLGVSSRREAVIKAIELELLDPEELVSEGELERLKLLPEREMEVLRHLADPSLPSFKTTKTTTNHEIGKRLGISPNTVRNHLVSVWEKLEIKRGPHLKGVRAAVIFLAYQPRKESMIKSTLFSGQNEVLRLLARGFANDEIATELGISKKAVGLRIHRIYSEFKIYGRSPNARLQLVKMAIQRGYLPPETDLSLFEPPLFTPGEEKVLALLALGEENKDIAGKLGIAWNTVKNYYNPSIFRKLGVETRTEVMIKALSEGLVDSDFLKERFADQIARLETLSPREREVLRYGATQGLFDKEIVRSLRIPIHVVRTRIKNILKKLGVKNRTQAALIFLLEHPPVESAKEESTSLSHETPRGRRGVGGW